MSETFIDLHVSCPAATCSNTQITYWVHAADSGRMEISNRARLRCGRCYTTEHMKNWLFACSDHEGVYKETSYDSFTKALNLAFKNQGNKQGD
ncbi:35298_t:CDS:2 [Racocetra persica]|uniref:35298_t:CDS:1 n=1 Tax=Racocetra persica TaxID=160502 RepID=A0ACA9L3Z3_9GLOM|nr:35298_t:CDS:2 [Racocetra persica]